MNEKKLAKAYSEIPPPPCEGCWMYQACIDDKLACEHFARNYIGIPGYSKSKKAAKRQMRIPTDKWYRLIFTDFGYDRERHGNSELGEGTGCTVGG
jgi:hypothetical protein